MNTKRVVITGMGIVSSIGNNVDEVKNFVSLSEKIFEDAKSNLSKHWNDFKELFDKKHISRKECLLLPLRTVFKALK